MSQEPPHLSTLTAPDQGRPPANHRLLIRIIPFTARTKEKANPQVDPCPAVHEDPSTAPYLPLEYPLLPSRRY